MANGITSDPTLASLQADISSLKQDLSSLLSHLKSGATASAQTAAGQIQDGAEQLYRTATTEGTKSAKLLGKQIEEQPVLALLIVLGIGYLGGRLLTR